jgi:hypothetical protein
VKKPKSESRKDVLEAVAAGGGSVVDAEKGLLLVPVRLSESWAITATLNAAMQLGVVEPDDHEQARWFVERLGKLQRECVELRGKEGPS